MLELISYYGYAVLLYNNIIPLEECTKQPTCRSTGQPPDQKKKYNRINRPPPSLPLYFLLLLLLLSLFLCLIGLVCLWTGTGRVGERLRPRSGPNRRRLHGADESRYQRRALCQRQRSFQPAGTTARTRRSQRRQRQDHLWQRRGHLQLAQRVSISS